ncbi:toxin glutamine deamidase domain-containing protein [Actinoplanes sp. NPDC026619]|uniref:toxin glutamine deamidase domain-containing protein n=1 Tax=Actinoplanes sp. NPDC026619 TaxID=3155798 RepID=UPI0033EFAADA
MTIPHPLERGPFDVPRWARDALERAVDADWPAGDEAATWAVADRWYAVAASLDAPHEAAFAAAAQIMSGPAKAGFQDSWQRLAGDAEAPLNSLIEIAGELGGLVEECGRALEAAKLAVWIEVGQFLIDLIGMAVAASLTLGAAAPVTVGLIAATRLTIQQIFERLTEQLEAGMSSPIAGSADEAAALSNVDLAQLPGSAGAPLARTSGAPVPGEAATRRLFAPSPPAHALPVPAAASSPDSPGSPDSPRQSGLADSEGGRVTRRMPRSEWGRLADALGVGRERRAPAEPGVRTVTLRPPGGLPPTAGPSTPDSSSAGPATSRASSSGGSADSEVPESAAEAPTIAFPAVPGPSLDRAPEDSGYASEVLRHEYGDYLTAVADETRARIRALGRLADQEILTGSTLRGEELRTRTTELHAFLGRIESTAAQVAGGELRPPIVLSPAASADPAAHRKPPADELAPGGVSTDHLSALTGKGGSLPIDSTRRYDTYGGLRAPLAVHQKALEEAVPRGGDGRALRLPDPRSGRWFHLANDGGPQADPTRALNCVDGVLALFDTYLHGRPRVAAPRTFDAYAAGDPDRPVGGEWHGLRRIELATGATFQNLCPFQGTAAPEVARSAIDAAMRNLANHLHNSGPGAFAFILTDLEGGGCHAWAAVNHEGVILFLDPQLSRISEEMPLYRHRGVPAIANVVSVDALVVDGKARPKPLPYHGAGQWSTASVLPTGKAFELI